MNNILIRSFILFFTLHFIFNITASGQFISGYIYDKESNSRLVGAEVYFVAEDWASLDIIDFEKCISDDNGYFQTPNLIADYNYTMVVSAKGYVSVDTARLAIPQNIDFYLSKVNDGFLVETMYQGFKKYIFENGTMKRVGGTVIKDDYFFSDIDLKSDSINIFYNRIGISTDTTSDESIIWQKCSLIWNWLKENAKYDINNSQHVIARNFLMNNGWPSIETIAKTYLRYGIIPWGTCMSRAQIYTSLLYGCGISKDIIAIAETRWRYSYSQHMYTIIHLVDRWLFLDPSYISWGFPNFQNFHSIPYTDNNRDYCHPYNIMAIPGSNIVYVPEVTNKWPNDNLNLLITSPPNLSHVSKSKVNISGTLKNINSSNILINGMETPIADNTFSMEINLNYGENNIIAEINNQDKTYRDAIMIVRDSGCVATNYFENINICEGDSYEGWSTNGEFVRKLTSSTGCDSIVTTNLVVRPIAETIENISICQGENYFGWTESGEYVRTLQTASGCDSIITTYLNVIPMSETTENITICYGENYLGWDQSGTYIRTLTAYSGCDSIINTILLVVDLPDPNFSFNADILTATNTYSTYQWYNENGIIEGATSSRYIIDKSGTYFLEVTNSNGCSAISDGMDIIKTGINDIIDNQNGFVVYPNPSDGRFKLAFSNFKIGKYHLQIINNLGDIVFEKYLHLGDDIHEEVIELSSLSKGIYFVKIFDKEITETRKIILK